MSNIKIVIATLLIILILLILSLFFLRQGSQKGNETSPIIQFSPGPSSASYPTSLQKPFRILETDPKNQQAGVYTGEIEISFITDNDILSDKDFSLDITPNLPFYFKFTNSYPTKKVVAKVYGGLQTNATYQLTVRNSTGQAVYSWSFATSAKTAESSSSLMKDQEENLIKKYYPLFDYVPYTSGDFDLDTNGRLTVDVKIKNPDINKAKQEVNDWIRSKGVDPATHTINYINSF